MGFASKGYVDSEVRAVEEELKSLITGGAQNLGTWDASTNTPTITQDSGPSNSFYDVKIAGTWNGMTFDVGDKIVSNKDSHWDRLATGALKNSRELKLSNRSKETISGISPTQEEANIEFVNAIKNIIIFTENVDNEVATKGAQKRPYYQIVDTPQREKGFYFVNEDNQIESFGGGVGKPDNISIEINSNNKLSIKGFEDAPAHKTMEKDENGNIIWVDAINIETLSGKLDKTTNPNKVYGTDTNGNQTTFDKNSFGQLDDVQVNNVSVVQNKIAKIDLTGKQDALSQTQLNAVNSGITLAKVSQYDTDISNLKENLANYIDTFATKAALDAYTGTLTNNDWAIVLDDETHSDQCWRYIYKKSTLSWAPQFMINETPMAQEQIEALNSGINSTKVSQIETNKTDIINKQDKVTPITAQTNFKLGKVKFDTQGHITAFEEMHLYEHHFVLQYGDRIQYPNVTATFKLTNTNQTALTYSELASWLYNNGFTDKYKLYSISGIRTSTTRYVASSSGGTNTTSATIVDVSDGLMSPDGEQILLVSNYGNQSNIGDGRAASPPSNIYNIYYVTTTQIF